MHRAVNGVKQPYEQVMVFLLDTPDAVVQPLAFRPRRGNSTYLPESRR